MPGLPTNAAAGKGFGARGTGSQTAGRGMPFRSGGGFVKVSPANYPKLKDKDKDSKINGLD